MSDLKTVNISADAAKDLMGGAKKGRRSTKKNQNGGADDTVKGVESQIGPAVAAAPPNSSSWLKYPTDAPVPPQIKINSMPPHMSSMLVPSPVVPPQTGGSTTKHIKVELKKKVATKNVHLNPKKADIEKTHSSKKQHTRKIRKITVGVSSLHKRLTHAKKLHKEIGDMPIDKLKDKLIKSGLIKSTSKAPDTIIRQIARDAAVVKNKAL